MGDGISVIFIRGVEGPSLYVNNYRVLGSKPWGGGTIVKEWTVSAATLMRDLTMAFGGKLPAAEGGPVCPAGAISERHPDNGKMEVRSLSADSGPPSGAGSYRKIMCPPQIDGWIWKATNLTTGEVQVCTDVAKLLRNIVNPADVRNVWRLEIETYVP
jgi:hypothetical protein